MKLLYTDILPIGVPEGGESFSSAVAAEIETAERVEIAVGYVSRASLLELDALVRNANETVRFLKDRGIVFDESIRGVFNPGDSRKTEIKHRSFPEKCWQVFKSLI